MRGFRLFEPSPEYHELHQPAQLVDPAPRVQFAQIVGADQVEEERCRMPSADFLHAIDGETRPGPAKFGVVHDKTRLIGDGGGHHGAAQLGRRGRPLQFVRRNSRRKKYDAVEFQSFDRIPRKDEVAVMNGIERAAIQAEAKRSGSGLRVHSAEFQVSGFGFWILGFELEGFSLRIPVKSPALEPIFKISPNHVSLGKQPAAKPGTEGVVVENIGGLQGSVILAAAAPFVVVPSRMVVNAGEKKSVGITLTPCASGKYRTWLEVKGGRQELEVGLEAELFGAAVKTRGASGGETIASAPVEGETSHAEPVSSEEREARNLTPSIPKEWGVAAAQAPGVKLLQTTPNSVTFEWPENLSSATQFRFELRHLALNASREMTVSWMEHRMVTVQHQNGRYTATLDDLQPQQNSTVQVLPLNDAGGPGTRIFALNFSTPAAPPSTPQISPLQWLLLALAVCVSIWMWRTLRRTPTNYL